jgi:hypothetical protein
VHDFGKMKGGEVAKYTYVFTNIGDRLLELTDVRVSCGCTTTGEWSRKADPGQTGSIPIEFNSGNFSGPVAKSITVTCNDTSQPTVALQLKATVWKPIDVTPQFAVLNVSTESPSNSTTVRIVNNMEEPLTLSTPESSDPRFTAELRTNQPGREFELTVRTGPPPPTNNMNGVISLKTSSTNMPTLNITAYATVQPAVVVTPAAITLPAAPMTQPAFYTVAIRNTSASALVLYDPAVNAQGVDVRLTEVEVGRHFTVTMTFPAGFEAAPGDEVELTVRSNHPQFPIIRVPARQPARPGSAVARAPGYVPPPAPRQEAAPLK